VSGRESELARLRREVEQLRRVLYPPPAPPSEPERPARPSIYIVAMNADLPAEANHTLSQQMLSYARSQQSDVDWSLVGDVADVPAGETFVHARDLMAVGWRWSSEVRFFRRATEVELAENPDRLCDYLPSQAERDDFKRMGAALFARIDAVLAEADAQYKAGAKQRAYGRLLVVDLALATQQKATAEFTAGVPWRQTYEGYDIQDRCRDMDNALKRQGRS
jgi:hypothetical protein